MNKILVFIGLSFFSFELFAGVCNNATVATTGGYSFSLTNTGGSSGQSASVVDAGRMVFNGLGGNGTGAMTVSGIEYQGAVTKYISSNPNVPGSVTGTYSVSTVCVMTATFKIPSTGPLVSEKTFTINVYLDRLDVVPATYIAYHGHAIFKTSNSMSGIGVFDRVIGKF